MLLIGLTGSLASGKSTAAQGLKNLGIPVIDADELSRVACAPGSLCLAKIVEHFGPSVLNPDQSLNRAQLARIVFADQEKLLLLESIVHPAIHQLFLAEKKRYEQSPVVIYMAPLLFEKKLEHLFARTILITAPDEILLKRAMMRDHLSQEEAKLRLAQQMSTQEKAAKADVVIDNSGSKEELYAKLKEALEKICNDNAGKEF